MVVVSEQVSDEFYCMNQGDILICIQKIIYSGSTVIKESREVNCEWEGLTLVEWKGLTLVAKILLLEDYLGIISASNKAIFQRVEDLEKRVPPKSAGERLVDRVSAIEDSLGLHLRVHSVETKTWNHNGVWLKTTKTDYSDEPEHPNTRSDRK